MGPSDPGSDSCSRPTTYHRAFCNSSGFRWLRNLGGHESGTGGGRGSLGELVSKLGYNLHKSPGVVGSGNRSTWGGWGNIGEQWKGGEWGTEHPAPLCPGKKTPAFSKQQFLTVTISLGAFAPDTEHPSPVQSRWFTGHWVKTENMAAVWRFLPD